VSEKPEVQWRVVSLGKDDGTYVECHVYPIGPGVAAHDERRDCWCRPQPDTQEPTLFVHGFGAE